MNRRLVRGTNLSRRLLIFYSATLLVMIALMAVAVESAARGALIEGVETDLERAGALAFESLPNDSADYQQWAEGVFEITSFRTTLIDAEGVVLADSHSDPATMDNHLLREEVQEALAGDLGVANRISASTGFDQRYIALPPVDGLLVRTSVPTRVINDDLTALRLAIGLAGAVIVALGVIVVANWARRMSRPITQLTLQAMAVADGDLDVAPRRSKVLEVDRLALAISSIATRLGSRISDAEEATETLRVVLEALPQGTVLIGVDDRVIYANRSARSILGAIPETVAELSPHVLQTAVREARETGDSQRRETDHGNPVRRLLGIAVPFQDDKRILLLAVDVTERERNDSVRRDFVANASHELKTPVATIMAASEALQIALERDDASATDFVTRIEDSARQLSSLVTDLLDLSRLERDRPELAPVRIDLLARDEVDRANAGQKDKGLEFVVETTETTAIASHGDLSIAVRNLLDNAIRYTDSGDTITVTVRHTDVFASITVADTGVGIPIRDMQRVFERFYRVDSARSRRTGGTGLGLSIAKHIAEAHGGSISVESELGVGSKFTISVPLGLQSELPDGN